MKNRLREIDAQRALGAVVSVSPDEADELGLFEETALSLEDALEARFDGEAPSGGGVALPSVSAAGAGFAEAVADAPETGGDEDGGGYDGDDKIDDDGEEEGPENG